MGPTAFSAPRLPGARTLVIAGNAHTALWADRARHPARRPELAERPARRARKSAVDYGNGKLLTNLSPQRFKAPVGRCGAGRAFRAEGVGPGAEPAKPGNRRGCRTACSPTSQGTQSPGGIHRGRSPCITPGRSPRTTPGAISPPTTRQAIPASFRQPEGAGTTRASAGYSRQHGAPTRRVPAWSAKESPPPPMGQD